MSCNRAFKHVQCVVACVCLEKVYPVRYVCHVEHTEQCCKPFANKIKISSTTMKEQNYS